MDQDVRIATAPQAKLLLNVELRPLLILLMSGPCNVSEAAEQLAITLNRTHYLMTKLEKAGVAVVDHVTARAGRAVKHYTIAPRWFIPFDVTPASTMTESASAQILPRIQQMVNRAIHLVQENTTQQRGYWLEPQSLKLGDENGPTEELFQGNQPFLLNIGKMHLSSDQASEFKCRLLALLEEFEGHESPSETPYSIALLLVRGQVD